MAEGNETHDYGWYPLQDQFASVRYHSHVIIGSFMVLILLLAVVGNTVVIVIFLCTRKLRTPSNSLIVNLAVADLLMALTGFPLLIISSFSGYWVYDDWVCDFYGTTATMFGLMSINTLVFISLDRYVVIVSPQHIHKVTYVHARFCIFAIWLYSFTWAIMPIFGWNRYIREGYGTTCTIDYFTREEPHNHFLLCMLLADYLMPCLLIIYCYVWIFHTVKSHSLAFFPILSDNKKSSRIGSGRSGGNRSSLRLFAPQGQTKDKHRRMKWTETEYKIARTIFLVVLFYCMAWTPYAVVTLVGQYGDVKRITPTVSMLPAVFAKISTVYNPIVYSLTHPRFKLQLKKILNVILPESTRQSHLSRDASSRMSSRVMHNRTMDTSESLSPSNGSFTESPFRKIEKYDDVLLMENFNRATVSPLPLKKHKDDDTSDTEADCIDELEPCLRPTGDNMGNEEFLTPIQEVPEQDSAFSTEELRLMKSAMSSGRKTLCRAVFMRHPERTKEQDRFKDDDMTKTNWRDISGESLISVNIEAIRMERNT